MIHVFSFRHIVCECIPCMSGRTAVTSATAILVLSAIGAGIASSGTTHAFYTENKINHQLNLPGEEIHRK